MMLETHEIEQNISLLLSEVEETHHAAIDALVAAGGEAVEPLRVALESNDARLRLCAAEVLGRIGSEAAVEALCSHLYDCDAKVIAAIRAALVRLQEKSILPLCGCLSDGRYYVRQAAVEALAEIGSPAIPALIALLKKDHSQRARASAAEALGKIKLPEVTEPLCDALLSDHSSNARSAAAWSLGHIADASSIEPLARGLRDRDLYVRICAATALNKIGEPEIIPRIVVTLSYPPERRYHLLVYLRELGYPCFLHHSGHEALPNRRETRS